MPTSAEHGPELLVDTSLAVALSVRDHEAHNAALTAVTGQRIGLAGHAAFETFSVLTRLPAPARRTPSAVMRLLSTNFPHTRFLSPERSAALLGQLAGAGVAGGSVYDALVGAVAGEQGVPLGTRDRRAMGIYRAMEVQVRLVA